MSFLELREKEAVFQAWQVDVFLVGGVSPTPREPAMVAQLPFLMKGPVASHLLLL